MNLDQQIFEYIVNRKPNFSKEEDIILMSSMWYLMESFGCTTGFENDLDELYCLTRKGVIRYDADFYLSQGEYLNKFNVNNYGKAFLESLKEALDQEKSINKDFMLKSLAVVDYINHYCLDENSSLVKVVSSLTPDFSYILPETSNTLTTVNTLLREKNSTDLNP